MVNKIDTPVWQQWALLVGRHVKDKAKRDRLIEAGFQAHHKARKRRGLNTPLHVRIVELNWAVAARHQVHFAPVCWLPPAHLRFPSDEERGEQIAYRRERAQWAFAHFLGQWVMDESNECSRRMLQDFHRGQVLKEGEELPTGFWQEHHGKGPTIPDPGWRLRIVKDCVAKAKSGERILLICRSLVTDHHLIEASTGTQADDTARLEWWQGDRLVEYALPKWRFPDGGWLVTAPRDWLATAPSWPGTQPTALDVMPSVVDWYSVPFPVVTVVPTSEADESKDDD